MTKTSKKQTNPLVSIILPVYNNSNSLHECLKSLLTQSYRQIEIIAIDDNSKDDSYKILKTYRKKHKRLRVWRNIKRYGLAITLNRCMKKAKGRYIALMNSSDEAKKNRIKNQLSYLLTHPKTVAIGTQCTFINEEGRRIGKSNFPIESDNIIKSLTNDSSLTFESFLINKYALPKDLLRFDNHTYPFLFTRLFTKMLTFGSIENLNQNLYLRIIYQKSRHSNFIDSLLPSCTAWMKTTFISGNRPPIRSLLFPLIKSPSVS